MQMLSSSLFILHLDCNKYCKDWEFTQGSSFCLTKVYSGFSCPSLRTSFPALHDELWLEGVSVTALIVSHIPLCTSALCFLLNTGIFFLFPTSAFLPGTQEYFIALAPVHLVLCMNPNCWNVPKTWSKN